MLNLKEMKMKTTVRDDYTPSTKAIIAKTNNIKVEKDVEWLELWYITGGNINWYRCFVKYVDSSFKNGILNYHTTQCFHSWVSSAREERKHGSPQRHVCECA